MWNYADRYRNGGSKPCADEGSDTGHDESLLAKVHAELVSKQVGGVALGPDPLSVLRRAIAHKDSRSTVLRSE